MKCPVIIMYEDKADPVLGKCDIKLAIIQREEKEKEEYEAFFDMHHADGVNTSTVYRTKL